MKTIKIICLIYLVALFSVTVLPRFHVFSSLPHLILILSLLFIFQKEFEKGLLWASLGGLFLDFFGFKFPSNIFLTTAIALLTWFLIQKFFESSNIYLFLAFCFLGSLIYDVLFSIIYRLNPLSYGLLFNALYSTLFGLIACLIYLRFQKRLKTGLSLIY